LGKTVQVVEYVFTYFTQMNLPVVLERGQQAAAAVEAVMQVILSLE
jgi:hypothetical protein